MSEGTPIPAPRNFPFTWEDPEDANRYWVTDLLHNAYPRVPLFSALTEAFSRGMGKAFAREGERPPPPRRMTINGYVYEEVRGGRAGSLGAPPPGLAVNALENWEQRVLPRVEAITGPLKAFPIDDVSLRELVDHALGLEEHIEELGTLHHRAVMPAGFAAGAFRMFCARVGLSAADSDAMLAGVEHLSLASSRQVWELGRTAARDSALAEALLETPPVEIEDCLQQFGERAAALLAGVEAHVQEFGWRPASLHPYSLPVVDDRAPVWEAIRSVASGDMQDPAERHAAVARRREELAARVRASLTGENLQEFERLHATALPRIRITEDHNVCMDQVMVALVQRACSRLASRLHEAGILTDEHDAYFLKLPELAGLDLTTPSTAIQETLTRRRQDWERCCTFTPPLALGTRPPDVDEFRDQFLGRVHEPTGNPRVLSGTPGSPGIATGAARVLRDMTEADRLGRGDILVCITTLPPWTPLFARAGGIVTVAGGALSHAAITAREFGIPAVLSVAEATTIIQDGRRVTVDGTNGVVRLEG